MKWNATTLSLLISLIKFVCKHLTLTDVVADLIYIILMHLGLETIEWYYLANFLSNIIILHLTVFSRISPHPFHRLVNAERKASRFADCREISGFFGSSWKSPDPNILKRNLTLSSARCILGNTRCCWVIQEGNTPVLYCSNKKNEVSRHCCYLYERARNCWFLYIYIILSRVAWY